MLAAKNHLSEYIHTLVHVSGTVDGCGNFNTECSKTTRYIWFSLYSVLIQDTF